MTPTFPGGTSLSHLRVYDWPADDAPGGSGSPHLHTTSTEAYVVLGGAGRIETLGADGYAETPLAEGAVVWFSPGVVHRVVNDGGLEVLVVMSNAGLPEAGDAVLTFPPDALADVDGYRRAAALPPGTGDDVAAAARARRDLALDGYEVLRRRVRASGPDARAALEELWTAAALLVRDRAPGWGRTWSGTVGAAAEATSRALGDLAGGTAPHLAASAVASALPAQAAEEDRRYGMCGRLRTWEL